MSSESSSTDATEVAGIDPMPGGRRRIDHVALATRMNDQGRARQLAHQRAGAAGMVEVHMRRDHELDGRARQAQRLERGQMARQREVGAGVDEGGAPAVDDEKRRVEARAMEAGVDGEDAVAEVFDEGGQVHAQRF